jgi:glycosyltransferase involved in cell wall biosynthesis
MTCRRIAIATESFGHNGGVGVYVVRLADALREAGHEVFVLAGEIEPEQHDGERTVTVPGLAARELSSAAAGRYAAALAEFAPDVVHVHHLYDPLVASLTRGHAPVVWGVHDYLCFSGSLYFRSGRACGRAHGPGCVPTMALRGCAHGWDPRGRFDNYRLTTRLVSLLREVDVALAYSSAVHRNLATNRVDGERITPFISSEVEVRPPGLDDRVLYVGRVNRSKGLGELIGAVSELDRGTLDVCGDGWWRQSAEKLVRRHRLGDRVRFLGWLGDDKLRAAYDRAAVVAVPSLWQEPFGMVGLEAMARGRPVVASDVGGILDWLVDGVTGLLAPPGDVGALASALRRLLADPELRARMGAAGADRVRDHFTADTHIAAIEHVNELARSRWSAVPASPVLG